MNIYLDVETIPCMHPLAKNEIRLGIKPPGTHKKPETIAAWYENEADAAADEQWRRQAMDGGTMGEIISIAIADDHDRHFVRCRQPGHGEAELLQQAFDAVEAWTEADAATLLPGRSDPFPLDSHLPVAHNAAFDLGFLWRRSIIHGVPRPRWLPGPMARVAKDYVCTMQAWAGYGKTVSLDVLCRALAVASPKGDMDGSKILDAWLSGQYQEIERYNLRDAVAVREVYHRLAGWRATA